MLRGRRDRRRESEDGMNDMNGLAAREAMTEQMALGLGERVFCCRPGSDYAAACVEDDAAVRARDESEAAERRGRVA